jgi:ABC-type transport system involved in multi-copper enzyme maturation permease subunit
MEDSMRRLFSLVINNFKEIIRQPFYYVILFSGCFMTIISFSFTFFTFGEEVRMIKNMGLSTITICGLLTGCLSSSILIANEFKRQTTLAVLSKPITRIHFILGKYLGIVLAATVLIFSQGLVLEVALAINKYLKISGMEHYASNLKSESLIDYHCLLGIYFSLLQVLILTAISVILSLYLDVTGNLIICFLVFVFCHTFNHIFPLHNQYINITSVLLAGCYIIFPNLHNLDMVTMNDIAFRAKPMYIAYTTIYTTIYSISVLWLAIFFFKRKEIV